MSIQSDYGSQRLSVAAVRDCGLLSCLNAPKFERGRMLDLPLKPLLLLHFVRQRNSLSICILSLSLL